jgi:hypothetical protein
MLSETHESKKIRLIILYSTWKKYGIFYKLNPSTNRIKIYVFYEPYVP